MISFKKYQQSKVDSRLLKNRHPTQIATSLTLVTPSSSPHSNIPDETFEGQKFFFLQKVAPLHKYIYLYSVVSVCRKLFSAPCDFHIFLSNGYGKNQC